MARPIDRDLFKRLWKELLKDNDDKGSFTPPSENNIEASARIFDAYIGGWTDQGVYVPPTLEGIVLFIGNDAVLMWGDGGPNGLESSLPRKAIGWGTYVSPAFRKQNLSKKMRDKAKKLLYDMGFTHVLGTAVQNNTAGFESGVKAGFELIATLHLLTLSKEISKEAPDEHQVDTTYD